MWLEFAGLIAATIVVAYVPGYLVGRSLGFTRITSLSVAVLLLFFAILGLGIVLEKLGIAIPGWALMSIIAGCALLLWIVVTVLKRNRQRKTAAEQSAPISCETGQNIRTSPVASITDAETKLTLTNSGDGTNADSPADRVLVLDEELSPSDLYNEWVLSQDGVDEARSNGRRLKDSGRTAEGTRGAAQSQGFLNGAAVGVKDSRRNGVILGIYILVGALMASFVFLAALDTPESFGHFDDNTSHYNFIRSFLETQYYSILQVNGYIGLENYNGEFYPALWHIFTACIANISGASVMMAFNASVFVLTAVVLPVGWFALLATLFPRRVDVLVAGSLCCVAFGAFPWGFLVFGQLVSNMASFAMIPAVVAFFITTVRSTITRGRRGVYAFIIVAAFGGLAGAQPNAIFTAGLFCLFWLIYYVMYVIDKRSSVKNVFAFQVIAFILIFAAVCLIWAAFYYAPFMQDVVTTDWGAYGGIPQAIFRGLTLMVGRREDPQILLGLLVLVGLIGAFRIKGYRWLGAFYLFVLFLYVVDAGTEESFTNVLTGFWYNDPYRVGAMLALSATPLAALGLANTIRMVARGLGALLDRRHRSESDIAEDRPGRHADYSDLVRHAGKKRVKKRWSTYIASAVLVILVLVATLIHPFKYMLPNGVTYKSGLQKIQNQLIERYSWEDGGYGLDGEQYTFLQEVSETVPQDELILNVPNDGSGWGYGIEGLNVNWRGFKQNRAIVPDDTLRLYLADIATRPDVQQAVEDGGFEYLLRLDSGADHTSGLRTKGYRYKPEDWAGIESVTDETPGFEVVLADGDMRLYKIVAD